MRRLPSIPEDKLTDSQLAVLRAIQSGPRGKIPMTGPFGYGLEQKYRRCDSKPWCFIAI